MVCAEGWTVNRERAAGSRFAASAGDEQRLSKLISDCVVNGSRRWPGVRSVQVTDATSALNSADELKATRNF
jgi:hypothetical protein